MINYDITSICAPIGLWILLTRRLSVSTIRALPPKNGFRFSGKKRISKLNIFPYEVTDTLKIKSEKSDSKPGLKIYGLILRYG